MRLLVTIVVILLQFVGGQILGFGVAFAFKVGNGWELVVMPIGNTVGVWGVGAIAAAVGSTVAEPRYGARLLGTAVGSLIGVVIILLTPAIGHTQILFPLMGALLGFYLLPLVSLTMTSKK